MENTIKLAGNTISPEEIKSLSDWLLTNSQLTKGPLTREFESAFSDYIGSKFAVMVNSGSSANLLMAYSLLEAGYLKNKKVIVPAVSWITTLSPFLQLGFECILCDSDPDNLGIDLNHLESLLKKHEPSICILVHVLGHIPQMSEINGLCERFGCLVIEDACEALGSEYKGVRAGALSLAGSFSFYYGHHISTIEGGAVTTSDKKLYSIMLSIRSHGWTRDIPSEDKAAWALASKIDEFRELYTFYFPGYNLRPTEINAFLGLLQLRRLEEIVRIREKNFLEYKTELAGFWCQSSDTSPLSSFAYGTFVANRLQLSNHLKECGIECRPLICGSMGRQPFWIKKFGITNLPVADRVHDYGLYLPNHTSLHSNDIQRLATCFLEKAIPG